MGFPVLREDGVTHGDGALPEALAAQPVKPHLIHETVVAELAARRRGTHATRNRAAVRGGGAKPWRQKGTGRARQGSIRSPQWTGGGVVFGPTPRSHDKKVNRKVRAQAFRSALRSHLDRGSVAVMDPTGWEAPSTKRAVAYLAEAPDALAARPLLVVVDDPAGVDACSFRNLPGVFVLAAEEVETVDLMSGRALLVARAAWERLAGAPAEVSPVEAKPKPKPKPKPKRAAKPKPKPEPVEEPVAAEEPATAEEPAAAAPEAGEPMAVEEAPAAVEEAPVADEPAAETEEPAAEPETPKPARPRRSRAKAAPKADPDAEAAESDAPEAEAAEEPAPKPARPRRTRAKKAPEPEPEAEADAAPEGDAAPEADAPETPDAEKEA